MTTLERQKASLGDEFARLVFFIHKIHLQVHVPPESPHPKLHSEQIIERNTVKPKSIKKMRKTMRILTALMLLSCLQANATNHARIYGAEMENRLTIRDLQVLDRYEIGEPTIRFAGKVVQLVFSLADEVPDGSVSVITFSDPECTVDVTGNDYLVPTILYDDNPAPDGTKNREVVLRYDIDPEEIQKTEVFFQDDKDQFFMNFCASLRLHDGDADGSNPIVTLETGVLLQVDLLGDFSEEVDAIPNDPSIESARQVYYADGFLCDENLERTTYTEPRVQGSDIRVCVVPRGDALVDGVYMRRIDTFTFQKDSPAGDDTKVTQAAVRDGKSANDALTELNCERGWELCYFDTQLTADFYRNAGIVFGYGEAWLQYGSGQVRKLKIDLPMRQLSQEVEGGFAGASQFNLDFYTIPGEAFEYGAVAYECDRNNRIVDPSPTKELGDTIRVCVAPNEETRQFGVTINRLEGWNWTHADGALQASVDFEGNAASDGLTILHCPSGSQLCIFRTQFTPDFFTSDGAIKGVATVVLQYAEIEPTATSRRTQTLEEENDLAIPGRSPVSVETSSKRSKDGRPSYCDFEHKVTEWWTEEPMNDRYIMIAIACVCASGICCSFLLCWCFPCFAKSDRETQGNQDVKVNIGMQSETVEKNTQNKSSTYNESRDLNMTGHSAGSKRGSKRSDLMIPYGSDSASPDEGDVCFGDVAHPGTKRLLRVVKRFRGKSAYGPDVYRDIKDDMGDVKYFVMPSKGLYVQATKKETVTHIGELFLDGDSGTASTSARDSKMTRKASSRRSMGGKKESSKQVSVSKEKTKSSSSRKITTKR